MRLIQERLLHGGLPQGGEIVGEYSNAWIDMRRDNALNTQKRKSVASNHVDDSTQITRYGVMRDSHRCNQAATHIAGS